MCRRIAFIINGLGCGGAEIHTIEIVNSLVKGDFEVMLVSLDSNRELIDRIHRDVRVVILGKKSFIDLSVINKLSITLEKFGADRLIMVNEHAMLYGYLAGININRKWEKNLIYHTTILYNKTEKLKNVIYRRIMNRMDNIVYVSRNQKEYWESNYGIRPALTKYIHSGIDVEYFSKYDIDRPTYRRDLGFSDIDIIICINAKFRPEKKHEEMIDALERLRQDGYEVKLLLVGDGERRQAIENYVALKRLREQVVFIGLVKDVRPYILCSDILALTSTTETFSLSVLEGMAMGKPLIISDVGGAREQVLQGVNGFVYTSGDIDELVSLIKKTMDEKLLEKMGQSSKERAKEYFSKGKMIEKYIEFLS